MDSIAGISAASAILSLVEFASKILKTGYEAYSNVEGAAQENIDLEQLTESLHQFQSRLVIPTVSDQTSEQRAYKKELRQLVDGCKVLAEELLALLEDLKAKGKGFARTWGSLRQACRTVWKKGQITRLQRILEQTSKQIDSRLLDLISQNTSVLCSRILDLEAAHSRDLHIVQVGLQEARDALMLKLNENLAMLDAIAVEKEKKKKEMEMERGKEKLLEEEQRQNMAVCYPQFHGFPPRIEILLQEATQTDKWTRILRTLLFKEMDGREEQINGSYSATFRWIFQHDTSSFQNWLRSSNEIFWVSGKAGSGKSTLMKFLAHHSETRRILKQWAGHYEPIIASYFFWSSGAKIQKTQIGLLQSLLFQILRQCPQLIPLASPRRWEASKTDSVGHDNWTRAELSSAIANILNHGRLTSRFCFFIDGLDEFADESIEGHQHIKLIEDLDLLVKSTQVKICVSSRPWTVFNERYGSQKDLKLVLQDLTSQDMYEFVNGKLTSDSRFKDLVKREPQARELVSQIRDRAEGVFLWVFLVVRELLIGLGERDHTHTLQQRLNDIPSDLEELLRKRVLNIPRIYRGEAMRAFQIALVEAPMPLMMFWYIGQETSNPRFAIEAKIVQIQQSELDLFNGDARVRVNKWCRDLLEVKLTLGKEQVHFLHRTVKDFLSTNEMQAYFHQFDSCGRSAREAMCNIYLAHIKAFSICQTARDVGVFFSRFDNAIAWARACETHDSDINPEILLALDDVRKIVEKNNPSVRAARIERGQPDNILQFAIREKMFSFVSLCLEHMPGMKSGTLGYAILPSIRGVAPAHMELSLRMINILIDKGVDPNDAWVSPDTAWQSFLRVCYKTPSLYRFAEPLLRHGADICAKIGVTADSRRARPKPQEMDVRTCLLGQNRPGRGEANYDADAERNIDRWLTEASARQPAKVSNDQTETSKKFSFRAKVKKLLE